MLMEFLEKILIILIFLQKTVSTFLQKPRLILQLSLNPLYTDKILFDNGTNQQDIDLVTLVQDANFIYPGKDPISMKIDSLTFDGKPTTIKGRFLTDAELNFYKSKTIRNLWLRCCPKK